MPDWRNPVGFACHAGGTHPAEEHFGVCASVQGLESGASAFVAGATVLGLNHLPLLLVTLDPEKWQVQLGYDYNTGEVAAIKIMHYEIQLPPETLTYDVLWKVNRVRQVLLDALTPWEENSRDAPPRGGKGGGRGPGFGYIWVGDVSHEMSELLAEVWPTPEPVNRPKRVAWTSAVGEMVSQVHQWLQPLAEEFDWDAADTRHSQPQGGGQGKQSKSSKASAADQEVVKKIADHLRKQQGQEDRMSALCGRFRTSPKVLQKGGGMFDIRPHSNGQDFVVRLAGGTNGFASWEVGGSKKGGGGKGGGAKGGGKSSSSKGGASPTAGVDRRIEELCRAPGVACQLADFDNRVRRFIQHFERRRGREAASAAFEMLAEWCARKERDQVRSWTAYLMVLLRNWEQTTFPEDDAENGDKPYQ
uniref:Uncharacterized protein n=1 Tax=Zooxanthella nutricula TaxID=1333877 RepID=A0A7S2LBD3_9DINO